jgi:hypothetical protein
MPFQAVASDWLRTNRRQPRSDRLNLDLRSLPAPVADLIPEAMNTTPCATDDEQHLRLLSIFHYVAGGLTTLFACFPLIHVAIGLAMVFSPHSMSNRPRDVPPAFVGWLFTCFGIGMFLAGLAVAVCIVLAGRFIAQRRRYWFIFVVACFQCTIFPFGTVLGVFTLVVLSRPSVKSLFPVTAAQAT